MKYVKSFLLAFFLAAIAGYLSHAALGGSLPNIVQTGVEKYTDSRIAAKSFPISIYLLLMAAALAELFISFRISTKFIQIIVDKALARLLKVGGALIGALAGMTVAFYQGGSSADVRVGFGLMLMVATFIVAPIFIAMSLRLLSEDDPDPGRAKILRWTIRLTCAAILVIAVYGVIDEIFNNARSENWNGAAKSSLSL